MLYDCSACGSILTEEEIAHCCCDCGEIFCGFCSVNELAPDNQCYSCKHFEDLEHEADDDIRDGRIKHSHTAEDMITNLKRPWQD